MQSITQHRKFHSLLLEYSQATDNLKRDALKQQLWQEFGDERAVVVVDMSGFSRIVQQHGIIHYLAMIHRMQDTASPIIEQHGGRVIKYVADNCFATFPTPLMAVQGFIALNRALAAANVHTPDERHIWIACGIDYGRILVIDDADMYGHAVNRASKLGEDIAESRDILITHTAREQIFEPTPFGLEPANFSISGIELDAYYVRYDISVHDT